MPNKLPQETIDLLVSLRTSGVSTAQIWSQTKISKKTIISYTKGLDRGTCGCGRPGGHHGWCKVMYERHPERLEQDVRRCLDRGKWSEEAREYVRWTWANGGHEADIALGVNAILGRSDISPNAAAMMAGKLGVKRPPRRRRNTMAATGVAPPGPGSAVPLVRPLRFHLLAGFPAGELPVAGGPAALPLPMVAEGPAAEEPAAEDELEAPRTARVISLDPEVEAEIEAGIIKAAMKLAPPAAPPRAVPARGPPPPPVVAAPREAAVSKKGVPFRGLGTTGPDPFKELRLWNASRRGGWKP